MKTIALVAIATAILVAAPILGAMNTIWPNIIPLALLIAVPLWALLR